MKKLSPNVRLLVVILFLAGFNALASIYFFRIDLTAEKRFTLSNSFRKVLTDLPEPVTVDVLMGGQLSAKFKRFAGSAADLLNQAQDIAGVNLRYKFVSPDEKFPGSESSYADTIISAGYFPLNLTSQIEAGEAQQLVYPFAIIRAGERAIPVELYKSKSPMTSFSELGAAEALLEFRFAEGLAKIVQPRKTAIGYATGNGEPSDGRIEDLFRNVISPEYALFTFDLKTNKLLPPEMKALMIVKPSTGFSDLEKLKLDQYVMKGGRLLILMDRLNAELDSLQLQNRVIAFDRGLQLNDLLFAYGARVNADLLMDLQCDYLPFDVNGNGQFDFLPWNYFPVLESMNNHSVNKGLGFISGRFVNSIDTVTAAGIRKTFLLASSVNARKIGSPAIISPSENVIAPQDEKYRTPNIPVAVLLEGKFRSLFANRLTNDLRESLAGLGTTYVANAATASKIIIVGDGDIALNSSKRNEPIPMGMNPFTYGTQREFPFANAEFIRNCLSYLTDERDLSEAKSKEYVPRLIDSKKARAEKRFWQLVNLAVPVIIVIIFAMIFQFIRKRKYAR